MDDTRDDRIFRSTRIVSALVIPFLLVAFVILYLFPQTSGERFAWHVQPDLMAVYVGSGYIGGAVLFLHALFGRRWHTVAAGLPAITVFTVDMLLATLLHWDFFDVTHIPFLVWLVLYIVTPVLVPWVYLHNRVTDPGTLEAGDVEVPAPVRLIMRVLGLSITAVAAAGFVAPGLLIAVWPWHLSVLAVQLLAGWIALIGVGDLVISADRRWSAWRVGIESIGLWHLLFLAGAVFHQGDFTGGNLANWYVLSTVAILIGMGAFYAIMEMRRRAGAMLGETAR